MKYPEKQLAILKKAISELSAHFDLSKVDPNHLHYIVFQNGSEGQTHNHFYIKGGSISRMHAISDLSGWTKLINVPSSFELYPDGCNDNHVLTAVKHCLKSLQL